MKNGQGIEGDPRAKEGMYAGNGSFQPPNPHAPEALVPATAALAPEETPNQKLLKAIILYAGRHDLIVKSRPIFDKRNCPDVQKLVIDSKSADFPTRGPLTEASVNRLVSDLFEGIPHEDMITINKAVFGRDEAKPVARLEDPAWGFVGNMSQYLAAEKITLAQLVAGAAAKMAEPIDTAALEQKILAAIGQNTSDVYQNKYFGFTLPTMRLFDAVNHVRVARGAKPFSSPNEIYLLVIDETKPTINALRAIHAKMVTLLGRGNLKHIWDYEQLAQRANIERKELFSLFRDPAKAWCFPADKQRTDKLSDATQPSAALAKLCQLIGTDPHTLYPHEQWITILTHRGITAASVAIADELVNITFEKGNEAVSKDTRSIPILVENDLTVADLVQRLSKYQPPEGVALTPINESNIFYIFDRPNTVFSPLGRHTNLLCLRVFDEVNLCRMEKGLDPYTSMAVFYGIDDRPEPQDQIHAIGQQIFDKVLERLRDDKLKYILSFKHLLELTQLSESTLKTLFFQPYYAFNLLADTKGEIAPNSPLAKLAVVLKCTPEDLCPVELWQKAFTIYKASKPDTAAKEEPPAGADQTVVAAAKDAAPAVAIPPKVKTAEPSAAIPNLSATPAPIVDAFEATALELVRHYRMIMDGAELAPKVLLTSIGGINSTGATRPTEEVAGVLSLKPSQAQAKYDDTLSLLAKAAGLESTRGIVDALQFFERSTDAPFVREFLAGTADETIAARISAVMPEPVEVADIARSRRNLIVRMAEKLQPNR